MAGGGAHGVLITRPVAEAEATAERVRALGFVPVVAPLMVVEPRCLRRPRRFDAVLLTSGNAVGAVAGLGGVPVFAVGDVTAARARGAGLQEVVSAGGDASALLEVVRRRCAPGATLLLVAGEGQGSALTGRLREAGFIVHRRVGYAARPVRRLPEAAVWALRAGELRAGLFLSGETARCFVRLLPGALHPALGGVEALAIGEVAAAHLALLPWRRVRVSLGPTLEQVLALL